MGSNSFFGVSFCHVAPLARLRGGMDAESAGMTVEVGKLQYLPREGMWYVHCKHCDQEARLQARKEEDAYGMLDEWRLLMPSKPIKLCFWSCPTCAEGHQDPKPTTTDTAESARQEVDDLKLEVQQLKAEVVELKAEVERLKAEAVELKDEDTKQTTKARPGPTIVVAFTEDEAKEMRDIAEETGRCGQALVHLAVGICGPCNPWSLTSIAHGMEWDGNRIVTLSSRLLNLLSSRSRSDS
ncbi:hypothetical protein N9L68_08890 [bacterium]|nr:hypothetical protein [bacterium]